ncbi:hypothetical protein [Capnocytophaga canimorsus]|uniref:hypothetical protein n=1 Tax=Capnocytophaga canimorsus TaxID=28188 RepID=UPI0037D43800
MKLSADDKKALQQWEVFYKNLQREDSVDLNESPIAKAERIKQLEADPEAWFKYYFWDFCTSEPADFHKKSTKRILNNSEWYEVRAWSRELAKSARTMLEMAYLTLTGKKKFVIYTSATKESAVRLLAPLKQAFEQRERIINDYGEQVNWGHWAEDNFLTNSGTLFLAIGAGQSPRGARNKEARPDVIVVDDFDTDEDCRNPDIVDKKWDWFEKALYGARSINNDLLVIFNGNIIADYCCIKKAIEQSTHYEIVNIRDKHGKSTWASKNSEEYIDRALSKISQKAVQGEYFNNPLTIGKVFKELNYGKVQPLSKYKFLIAYTDPSYKKNGDYKATALVGKYKDEYHVLWFRCRKTSISEMVDWQFDVLNFVNGKTAVYLFIEYPWVDEPLKMEIKKGEQKHNLTLPLRADDRKKPEKFFRIESTLEPLNRNGKLIFDERLKDTKDMKEVEFQFLALSPKSRANDDAPDAVEGAVWKVNHKNKQDVAPPQVWEKPINRKRF